MQRRVVEALDRLTGDPPAGDVVRLAGVEDEWRLRVGDWRVRFTRDRDGRSPRRPRASRACRGV